MALWLADGLWSRLDARCDWQLAHRMTKLMCDVAEGRADPELNACAWLLHGRSEASLGNYAQAIACLERATVAWRELENPIGVALALNGLGIVEAAAGARKSHSPATPRRWDSSSVHPPRSGSPRRWWA